jgi:hypothetical protein
MSCDPGTDREAIIAVLDTLDAAHDELANMSLDALTHPELLDVLARLESHTWRTPAVRQRLIARLHAEVSPVELGATSIAAAIAERLRLSRSDARRRIGDAEHLGPRRTLSGEPLQPKLTKTATAQADGKIGPEHVRIIRKFFDDIPDAVDFQTREQSEATLARVAAEHTPEGLRAAADRLMALIHPDGDFTDADRERRRFLSVGKQQADGMSPIRGLLDPQGRATFDAWQATWAAPGMCNPAPTKPPVWTASPPRRPRTPICGPNPNATTTRSPRWAAPYSRRENSVSTTAYRPPSSCPPPCRTSNPAQATPSPPGDRYYPCAT